MGGNRTRHQEYHPRRGRDGDLGVHDAHHEQAGEQKLGRADHPAERIRKTVAGEFLSDVPRAVGPIPRSPISPDDPDVHDSQSDDELQRDGEAGHGILLTIVMCSLY